LACEQAGTTVYLPKPMTSGLHAKGRFGKQDFVYVAAGDVYLCPAGERLTYSLYQRRGRQDTASLLGPLPVRLRAEGRVHNRQRAANLTLGA